jgi:hypothetical protein
VATIIRAVATLLWPIALVISVFLFREQIAGLIARVLRISFPGGSVELEALQEAKAVLQEVKSDEAVPAEIRERAESASGGLDDVAAAWARQAPPSRSVSDWLRQMEFDARYRDPQATMRQRSAGAFGPAVFEGRETAGGTDGQPPEAGKDGAAPPP